MLITHKKKKKNKFIVSERQYIGITATINAFRSTLASCEVFSCKGWRTNRGTKEAVTSGEFGGEWRAQDILMSFVLVVYLEMASEIEVVSEGLI